MTEACAQLQDSRTVLAFLIGFAVVDYWLGKTKKVRAASLLELVISIVAVTLSIVLVLLKPKDK